jgi:hypothetical protein
MTCSFIIDGERNLKTDSGQKGKRMTEKEKTRLLFRTFRAAGVMISAGFMNTEASYFIFR